MPSDGGADRSRAVRGTEYGGRARLKKAQTSRRQRRLRSSATGRAVMLHLRARYVSKAAILTIPASLMPVENRSPA